MNQIILLFVKHREHTLVAHVVIYLGYDLIGRVRNMFDNAGVLWQMAPLGAVDAGGGGTIAGITAQRNIDTIDAGVPVLSMHAPYEIISKVDNYMSYKGMLAVFNEK